MAFLSVPITAAAARVFELRQSANPSEDAPSPRASPGVGAGRERPIAPGGTLVFNVFYPGCEFLNGPEGTPVLELETRHPATGLPVRIYDTRTLDCVEQVQHSQVEIQELHADGRATAVHRSETDMRWTFKPEMELLLGGAGFSRWQICGGFDRWPLTRDDDQMIVFT